MELKGQRLKHREIADLKAIILREQGYTCLLCKTPMQNFESKNICLDHCHKTGYIRGVLCRNCNGILGKVENLATRAKKDLTHIAWLENSVQFLNTHTQAPVYNCLHPTFKTEAEKRAVRAKKAKERRTNGNRKT